MQGPWHKTQDRTPSLKQAGFVLVNLYMRVVPPRSPAVFGAAPIRNSLPPCQAACSQEACQTIDRVRCKAMMSILLCIRKY